MTRTQLVLLLALHLPRSCRACSCPQAFPECGTDGWCYDSAEQSDWCDVGEDATCDTEGCGAYWGDWCTTSGDSTATSVPPAPPRGCYALTDSPGCSSRNELGVTTGSTREACQAACDADCHCVSYEFYPPKSACQLSTSCTAELMNVADGSEWEAHRTTIQPCTHGHSGQPCMMT